MKCGDGELRAQSSQREALLSPTDLGGRQLRCAKTFPVDATRLESVFCHD